MGIKPTIQELLERPVIREHACFKWMTKLSEEEMKAWEDQTWKEIEADPDIDRMDRGHTMTARTIDREILYELFELGNYETTHT